MKASVVIDRARLDLDDLVEPYFWPQALLLTYLEEGLFDFHTRGYPIIDSTSPDVCFIGYSANQYEVPYHQCIQKILTITREDSDGRRFPVTISTNVNLFSRKNYRTSGYSSDPFTVPQTDRASDHFEVLIDYDTNFMRLSSPAATDGTLLLQVHRLPKDLLEDVDDEIDLRREHISTLVQWVCYRAWLKQDAETFDTKAAKDSKKEYEDGVDNAYTEFLRRHSTPGLVAYGGI